MYSNKNCIHVHMYIVVIINDINWGARDRDARSSAPQLMSYK